MSLKDSEETRWADSLLPLRLYAIVVLVLAARFVAARQASDAAINLWWLVDVTNLALVLLCPLLVLVALGISARGLVTGRRIRWHYQAGLLAGIVLFAFFALLFVLAVTPETGLRLMTAPAGPLVGSATSSG